MITAVIVDDEEKGRFVLNKTIENNIPNIKVVGHAKDVCSAIDIIEQKKPQLVFLDINLPDGTGFDIIKKSKYNNFEVIFITAHNDYALQAIKESAIDYLLKPILAEDLVLAYEKLIKVIELKNKSSYPSIEVKKLILPTSKSIRFINPLQITYIEADGNYSRVVFKSGETIQSTKAIKNLEELLDSSIFFRIHKSYIVNIHEVVEIDQNNNVVLNNNYIVEISRRKKADFLQAFSKL